MMKSLTSACLMVAALAAGTILAQPAHAAAEKSCSAVTFRGLPSGSPDGQSNEAGLYNARFGRITVNGTVKGGEATDYSLAVKGTTLDAATSLPKDAEACLKAKGLAVPPAAAAQACHGEKLKLAIVPEGAKRVLVLYAGKPRAWSYCRTSIFNG